MAEKFELPDWIPRDAWRGFVEMRNKIKAPMTDRAKKMIVTELDKLRNMGQDVGAILDQSVYHSWRGVFPLKPDTGNMKAQQYHQPQEIKPSITYEQWKKEQEYYNSMEN